MKKHLILSLFALGGVFLASCEKEDDTLPETITNKPTIVLDSANVVMQRDTVCGHEEANVMHITAGDTLKMYFTITGEAALSQYKLAAHENFDCHSHGEMKKEDGDLNAWESNVIETIPGNVMTYKVAAVHPIADSATKGQYHYSINAVDQQGNEAEELEYNIKVK